MTDDSTTLAEFSPQKGVWDLPNPADWPIDRRLKRVRIFGEPDHRGWVFFDVLWWGAPRRSIPRHACAFANPPIGPDFVYDDP